jgi:zinc transporter, ZIP family
VLEAGFWGFVGGSSLLAGAAIGYFAPIHDRALGLVMGFGAGALISAMAFELTEDAFALGGADTVAAGLAAGALTYFAGDRYLESMGGDDGEEPSQRASIGLTLGAVLDGIPESAVIGITLLEGGEVGIAFLAAVFISNLPESLAASADMRGAYRFRHVLTIWTLVVAASTIAAALGFGLLDGASGDSIGFINAFAGGAVLTMLADDMIPEAYRRSRDWAGLATVLGFALAYLLSTLD